MATPRPRNHRPGMRKGELVRHLSEVHGVQRTAPGKVFKWELDRAHLDIHVADLLRLDPHPAGPLPHGRRPGPGPGPGTRR